MKLNIKEIFYSLQGEGGRMGEASVFIRLAKCNLSCSFCDTDFLNGSDMNPDEIFDAISEYPSKWIIWTGGEPTLQLRNEHLQFFRDKGYKQAIETNGTHRVPELIDYITCSPKQNYGKVKELLPEVDEIRIPVKSGDSIPDISIFPKAKKYFLSPVFDGKEIVKANVEYVVGYILTHPEWLLSLQMHKLIDIE
ncbi:7-carboxy-7-deazaguanine synthase QueE [Dysgonomonas sp. 520]|uniref:7-carboxy-7-deazaguanine synthase QueE n=1 Tax=Dysgonomonas sp. 520 TaxID=2302931 RepID=UPI0013D0B608|nr:7-carboxy-7-deazaguanine synthase QueE [Dysgonomonas sp. 520]NDW10403.1 radical SAM protein [Dysgonomonas sp. 520]